MIKDKNLLMKMLKTMKTIRHFEESATKLFEKGFIPGWLHTYIGEEAIATGACLSLKKEDYITSTHRGHGHCIAKGADLKKMMAELFGKESGYCKGKGGSMHISDASIGILGANGIVGGGIPIAAGAALACSYLKNNKICLSFFGDGASNQGSFHESLNLASAWGLPVVYVCENNLYACSVSQRTAQNIKDIAVRAEAYGIPGIICDGMNVIDVYEKVSLAVDRARNSKGPTLIEAKTYRFRGHWEGDPQIYKSREECDDWMKKDPIEKLINHVLKEKVLTNSELKNIDDGIIKEIEEAIDFAKSAPLSRNESALEDLFA